jgi:hypothetical protein
MSYIKQVEYKYRVGQLLWTMHNDKPRMMIVDYINVTLETEHLKNTDNIYNNIYKKIVSIFYGNYPLKIKRLNYNLSLLHEDGTYQECPYTRLEHELFETKEQLIKSL